MAAKITWPIFSVLLLQCFLASITAELLVNLKHLSFRIDQTKLVVLLVRAWGKKERFNGIVFGLFIRL